MNKILQKTYFKKKMVLEDALYRFEQIGTER